MPKTKVAPTTQDRIELGHALDGVLLALAPWRQDTDRIPGIATSDAPPEDMTGVPVLDALLEACGEAWIAEARIRSVVPKAAPPVR